MTSNKNLCNQYRASKRRYKRACALTAKICKLSYIPKAMSSEGPTWSALYRLWATYERELGLDKLFPLIIHRLHWGVYPHRNYTALQKELLDIVYSEFTERGLGFYVWLERHDARSCFTATTESKTSKASADLCCRSEAHQQFLQARTFHLLFSRNPFQSSFSLNVIRDYKRAISVLLPASVLWSSEQWIDEMSIFASIKEAYGVDYTMHPSDYDRLITMTGIIEEQRKSKKTNVFYWYLMRIENLPFSLAKVFWPKQTITTLTALFLKLCDRVEAYEKQGRPYDYTLGLLADPVDVFGKEFLMNSWLFKLIESWIADGTIHNGRAVKKRIFDISIVI